MANPQFKILSIDGGGIRGIIPCAILAFIEKQTGVSVSGLFNLIAGTSTGGIIALGLTKPDENNQNAFSAAAMLELYVKNGKTIFPERHVDVLSWLSKKLFDKPYDSSGIEHLLLQYFGETKLSESLIDVLITTYEIQKGKPFYFSTLAASKDIGENFLMKEIARSTSAAPTYFRPSIVNIDKQNDLSFIDGGVFANNPSILAYGEAKELWKMKLQSAIKINPKVTGAKPFVPTVIPSNDDLPFYCLSLGTGHSPNKIKSSEIAKYRNVNWIEPLLTNVFMRSVAESTDFTMQHLLPPYENGSERYKRVDFEIPEEHSAMDDASDENISSLLDLANSFIKNNERSLTDICKILS